MDDLGSAILERLAEPLRADKLVSDLVSEGYDAREIRRKLAEMVRAGLVSRKPSYKDRVFLFARSRGPGIQA